MNLPQLCHEIPRPEAEGRGGESVMCEGSCLSDVTEQGAVCGCP